MTRCREVAKRLKCVQLAGAFEWPGAYESGSKLHALQTLRDIRLRVCRAALRCAATLETFVNEPAPASGPAKIWLPGHT